MSLGPLGGLGMGRFRIIAFALLAASAVAFATVFYVNGDSDWAPVQAPLPRPGLALASPFEIKAGGKFTIEATVPVGGANPGSVLPECSDQKVIVSPYSIEDSRVARNVCPIQNAHSSAWRFVLVSPLDLTRPRVHGLTRVMKREFGFTTRSPSSPAASRNPVLTRESRFPADIVIRASLLKPRGKWQLVVVQRTHTK